MIKIKVYEENIIISKEEFDAVKKVLDNYIESCYDYASENNCSTGVNGLIEVKIIKEMIKKYEKKKITIGH